MDDVSISTTEKCAMSLLLSISLIVIALTILSFGIPLSTLQSISATLRDPLARFACVSVLIGVFAFSYVWVTITESIVSRYEDDD